MTTLFDAGVDDGAPTTLCPLNPLELQIVRHLADGHTRARIARHLNMSQNSIPATFHRMYAKAGAVNAPHLTAIALRKGWIR